MKKKNKKKKKGKKKNAYLLLLLVLLLGITVGFATLSATLTINGTSTINGNTQWDVSPVPEDEDPHTGISCPSGEVCTINPDNPTSVVPDDGKPVCTDHDNDPSTADQCTDPVGAVIWTEGDTVHYKHLFVEPGETFTFDVTFKNTGTIEAELQSAVTGPLSATAAKYLTYEVKYADGTTPTAGDTLAAGASKTYRVTLTYNDYVETAGQPGSLPSAEEIAIINAEEHTFTATYVQA